MGVQIQGDTGNVIATKGTYSGDVSIGGTLTYEDVTNIDSVGIITARSNILVGSGITLSPDGDVFAVGVSSLGTGSDGGVELFHNGVSRLTAASYGIAVNGDILLSDALVHIGDTDTRIRFPDADTITAETAGTERLRIDSSGNVGISTESPTGKFSVGKVGAYLNQDGITVTNPHSSGLKNGVFVLTEGGYNATSSYRAAAFKAVGTSGIAVGVSTDQGSNGLGGTLNYSMTFDGKSTQDGSITANGSYYEESYSVAGSATFDKTITFNRRGIFLMLISNSLGTTTTDVTRNIYSLGLFTSRSNGATWTAIQQDLNSTHVGNFTISDAGSSGQLRVQKSGGSDNRQCAFRIDVLSTADVQITVTDT